jgi:hypothetical protein
MALPYLAGPRRAALALGRPSLSRLSAVLRPEGGRPSEPGCGGGRGGGGGSAGAARSVGQPPPALHCGPAGAAGGCSGRRLAPAPALQQRQRQLPRTFQPVLPCTSGE